MTVSGSRNDHLGAQANRTRKDASHSDHPFDILDGLSDVTTQFTGLLLNLAACALRFAFHPES
jgi:hypothetical protein